MRAFATTFVIALAILSAWALNTSVLGAAPFLRVISFVVAIASIVQIVELFVKKVTPSLRRGLGIFLPLIASNTQVLGRTIRQANRGYTLLEGMVFAVGGGIGIMAMLSIIGEIRERLEFATIPGVAQGPALVFLIVVMLSLVFMGFAGVGTA
jgi:electron transport complex protein RnfA